MANFLTLRSTLGAIAGSALMLSAAHAAAPLQKTQAPGYYRATVGAFEVTALSDGTVSLPMDKLLTNTKPAHVVDVLKKNFTAPPVETSVNAFLVNTGAKLVLIDAGTGGLFGPTAGVLVANLKAAGYQPEQVDEIYITHLHPDHVGGLVADGKPVFPNAVVRADKHDADFWLSPANLEKAPADAKGFFQGAMASLNPYVAAGRFVPFDGDTELVPGIKAVAAPGHTPGHSVYAVESQGAKLLVWGDVVHAAAVQFAEPSVTISFDADSPAAMKQRARLFAQTAQQGTLVAGAHLAFPGLGHVRADGKAYVWVPLNYSTLKF